jgi:hypothetical protein
MALEAEHLPNNVRLGVQIPVLPKKKKRRRKTKRSSGKSTCLTSIRP